RHLLLTTRLRRLSDGGSAGMDGGLSGSGGLVWPFPDQQFEELLLLSKQAVRQLRAGGRRGPAAGPPRPGVQASPKNGRHGRAGRLPGATGELEPGEALCDWGDHDAGRRVRGGPLRRETGGGAPSFRRRSTSPPTEQTSVRPKVASYAT